MKTLLIAVPLALAGCLPGDTRPEPGSVLTTVSGSEATREGFTTADGWQVTIESALLGAGPVQLGDDCDKFAEYSEPGYDRVLQLTQAPGQKLSIMFGLGQCDVDFQLSPPTEDAVLGKGVTQAQKTELRTPGSDAWVENDGVTLRVAGRATSGGVTKRFSWDFRQRLFFKSCSVVIDGVTHAGLDLRGGVRREYDLLMEIEGLFRDDAAPGASLRFAPFAAADDGDDGDGEVTLEELRQVSLDELRKTAPYSGGPSELGTLGDYVYRVLWPTLLRYRGTGKCDVALEED